MAGIGTIEGSREQSLKRILVLVVARLDRVAQAASQTISMYCETVKWIQTSSRQSLQISKVQKLQLIPNVYHTNDMALFD